MVEEPSPSWADHMSDGESDTVFVIEPNETLDSCDRLLSFFPVPGADGRCGCDGRCNWKSGFICAAVVTARERYPVFRFHLSSLLLTYNPPTRTGGLCQPGIPRVHGEQPCLVDGWKQPRAGPTRPVCRILLPTALSTVRKILPIGVWW